MKNSDHLQFERDRKLKINRGLTFSCQIFFIFITVSFILDFIFSGNISFSFPIIRFTLLTFILLVYILNKNYTMKKHPFPLIISLAFLVSLYLSFISNIDTSTANYSFAGIILMVLTFGIFLPLSLKEGIILYFLVWAPFLLFCFTLTGFQNVEKIINNNIFILLSMLISFYSLKNNFHEKKKSWLINKYFLSLQKKIQNHTDDFNNQIQRTKTQAADSEDTELIGQIASSFIHDHNNLLTIILGKSEMLYDSFAECDPRIKHVETILKTCRRAAELTKKMLAVSRSQVFMSSKKNLNKIIADVKEMVKNILSNNIEFIVKTEEKLKLTKIDAVQIEQILLNLCINARDAMPEGGKLIIESENVTLDETYCRTRNLPLDAGEYVMIAISDTGMGIDRELKTKIFEPYFTTKGKDSGTGLGLSSVHRIVKESKGDILVYSEKGKGTAFKLFFPAIKSEDEKNLSAEWNFGSELNNEKTILVAEDDESILRMTSCMLKDNGYNVLTAANSKAAISLAEKYKGKIDLLLADVVLPEMSGPELAKKITDLDPDIRVIFTSGFTSYMLKHHSLIDSSKDLIQKPFTTYELIKKIRTSLKTKEMRRDYDRPFDKEKLFWVNRIDDPISGEETGSREHRRISPPSPPAYLPQKNINW